MRTALFVAACHHDVNWLTNLNPSNPFEVYVAGCESNEIEAQGCRDEAHQYLSFIVEHYHNLPDRILFVHGHKRSSHYMWPVDRMIMLLLNQTKYLANVQFGGLYCASNVEPAAPGWCKGQHITPSECTETRLWERMYANTGVEQPRMEKDYFYPCCGTFFATRGAILRRPKHVYHQILHNMKTNFEKEYREKRVCGRVLESSWHTLFLPSNTSYIPPPYCMPDDPQNSRGRCPLNPCPYDHTTTRVIEYASYTAMALTSFLATVVVFRLPSILKICVGRKHAVGP